jgi:hypothetical protein
VAQPEIRELCCELSVEKNVANGFRKLRQNIAGARFGENAVCDDVAEQIALSAILHNDEDEPGVEKDFLEMNNIRMDI